VIYLSGAVRSELVGDPRLGIIVNPDMGNRIPADVPFALDNGVFGAWRRGVRHETDNWLRWLDKQPRDNCLFAVAPDIIGADSCWESFDYSYPFLRRIRDLGFPAALVAQDVFNMIDDSHFDDDTGDNLDRIWNEDDSLKDFFDVLFIGGTLVCSDDGPALDPSRRPPGGCDSRILTPGSSRCHVCGGDAVEWKETAECAEVIGWAKAAGKRVHMGRVNSYRRFAIAAGFECDSVDGTFLAYGPDKNLPILRSWFHRLEGTSRQLRLPLVA